MFSDIDRHWASACITALAKRGLISGYSNNTFRPKAVVNRAEFAALMQKAFPDLTDKRPALDFQDVFVEHWASDAIAWSTQVGLFRGYSNNRFLPQQALSRVQAIIVTMAALSAEQASEAISEPEAQTAEQKRIELVTQTFSDASSIPTYAKATVGAALEQQLLETLAAPRALHPDQAITRGEVAGLLCRALGIPSQELVRDYPELSKSRKAIFQAFLAKEASFNAEKLAFLDSGIRRSPFRRDIAKAAVRLQAPAGIPQVAADTAAAYPRRSDRPAMDGGGLDFLSPQMLSGCLCLAAQSEGQLKARWLGRDAFANRQMWSSTKFVPLLNLVDRVNAIAPTTDIDQYQIRRADGRGFSFHSLASGIMSYDNRIATSNSLAAMFKHFETPAGLEQWFKQMTGNLKMSFQGRYGELPFIDRPQLWDKNRRRVLIKSPGQAHRGDNLVSTYDLTRLITMAGWHWRLPMRSRLPNVQTNSLESVLRAMGVDTARYIDIALETLGLSGVVQSPVILSKSGFGRSNLRDRTELTYCALAQFSLPKKGASDPTASHQTYTFGLTLIAAQKTGDANQEARSVDALMAAEVTEIIRRIVTEQI
ncbi:MAG: S-layer homology domain-containing protein [Cyanobacteria bacterium J06643_4]